MRNKRLKRKRGQEREGGGGERKGTGRKEIKEEKRVCAHMCWEWLQTPPPTPLAPLSTPTPGKVRSMDTQWVDSMLSLFTYLNLLDPAVNSTSLLGPAFTFNIVN